MTIDKKIKNTLQTKTSLTMESAHNNKTNSCSNTVSIFDMDC